MMLASLSQTSFLMLRFSDILKKGSRTDTWYGKMSDMEEKLAKHRQEVMQLFPYLSSEDLIVPGVSLGSGYSLDDKTDPELQKFCRQELELRVGLGHEIVQDMRTAASLAYRLQGQQWTETRGVIEMKRVAEAQKRTSNRKAKLAADYNHNWRRISSLLECSWIDADDREQALLGLEKLNSEADIHYFTNPGVQTANYMGHIDDTASWIWKVQMLGSGASTDREERAKAVRAWEKECESIHSINKKSKS